MNLEKQEAERIFKDCVVIMHDWSEYYIMSLSIEKIKQDNQCKWHRCKRMSLKIVDEIIESHAMSILCEDMVLDYWNEVKQEISKL